MSAHLHPAGPSADRLDYARGVIRAEAAALEIAAERLDAAFSRAVDLLWRRAGPHHGRVAVTGTGKSADVGQKIAGTLNSTGTRAFVLDATRAVHGDLGMLHPDDVALVLSHSGESEEIVRLLGPLRPMVRAVIVALVYGPIDEVCPLGLAPSASTTVMLAVGDALAFTLSRERDFTHEDFARYHPAGSLGRKLLRVETVMRKGGDLRAAQAADTVREVFARSRHRGRRTGAVLLLDDAGRLAGIFTDSDLARLIEARRDAALDRPIAEVMTADPITVPLGTRVLDAIEVLRRHKISELPVIDADRRPAGLLDVTDLIGSSEESVECGVRSAELKKAMSA